MQCAQQWQYLRTYECNNDYPIDGKQGQGMVNVKLLGWGATTPSVTDMLCHTDCAAQHCAGLIRSLVLLPFWAVVEPISRAGRRAAMQLTASSFTQNFAPAKHNKGKPCNNLHA